MEKYCKQVNTEQYVEHSDKRNQEGKAEQGRGVNELEGRGVCCDKMVRDRLGVRTIGQRLHDMVEGSLPTPPGRASRQRD